MAIGGLTRFRPQRKRAFFTRETQEMPDPGLTPHAPKIRHIYQDMAKSTSSIKSPAPNASDAPDDTALPATYEAALQELEALVASLESGQLPLDQLLTGYQRGAQLLAFCKGRLEAVETQIKVLDGTELKPWASA